MAFEEYTGERTSVIRDGRISLTNLYINLVGTKLPYQWVRIQSDTETNRIRFVEGDQDNGYQVRKGKGIPQMINCSGFLKQRIIPLGIYKPVPGEELTYEFERPPLRWRTKS